MPERAHQGRAKDLTCWHETGIASAKGFGQGSLMNKEGRNCVWGGLQEERQEPQKVCVEYATRGHRETQKSKWLFEQVPQSNRMTDQVSLGRAVQEVWHGGVMQGLPKREEKGWGWQRTKDWAVRKEPVVGQGQVWTRLEETGQKEPRLGRMSTRKHTSLRSPLGNENFTSTPPLANIWEFF